MKVFAISDLHLSINNPKPMDVFGGAWNNYVQEIVDFWQANITNDDIVLLAGDFSWAMKLDGVKPDLEFIGGLPGRKVLLKGNHDYWWHSVSALRAILPYNMYAVQNDCLRIGNILICGTRGWTTPEKKDFSAEDKKIYDREAIRLSLSLEAMRKERRSGDFVIAMTHYPPFDSTFSPSPFTEQMTASGVDAVVYGHLHGRTPRLKKVVTIDGIPYYLTSCDMISNIPVVIYDDSVQGE